MKKLMIVLFVILFVVPSASFATISPKVGFMSGALSSSFSLGTEVSMPIIPTIDGMADIMFTPGSGYSLIGISGNGIFNFPAIPGMPGNLYAGGGLVYEILNLNGFGSTGSFGFQALGGMNIPLSVAGTAFVQIKEILSTDFGFGGFLLEGGYRLGL